MEKHRTFVPGQTNAKGLLQPFGLRNDGEFNTCRHGGFPIRTAVFLSLSIKDWRLDGHLQIYQKREA
jgi:hypothetical protein